MIAAGRLDRMIKIQEKEESVDALGTPVEDDWVDIATVPAQVIAVSGTEALASDKITAKVVNKFFIRYFSTLNEEHRIYYNDLEWDILYIREIGRRQGHEILAECKT
jgi:SPP1 family predicted phage head-tail adaptor